MKISGKVFEIIKINDTIFNLVLSKKKNGNQYYLCFSSYNYQTELMRDLNIRSKDNVKISFYPKSKRIEKEGGEVRYFTNLIITNIELIKRDEQNLFNQPNTMLVDKDTGEVINELNEK